MDISAPSLISRPAASAKTGDPKSTFYDKVAKGQLPSPIYVGTAARWVSLEIDKVVLFRIAGRSVDQIRKLVADMIASRAEPDYLARLRAVDPPARATRKTAAVA